MKRINLLLLLSLVACNFSKQQPESNVPAPDTFSKAASAPVTPYPTKFGEYSIVTFQNTPPAAGFGYDILKNGSPYVHQPMIPAVPGNDGFSTEEKAGKAAAFVIYKIQHNILPPTVEVRELDSLGVLR
jgi:hypothetical protein